MSESYWASSIRIIALTGLVAVLLYANYNHVDTRDALTVIEIFGGGILAEGAIRGISTAMKKRS